MWPFCPKPLERTTKWLPFYLNWTGFWMVGTIALATVGVWILSIGIPNTLEFWSFWISDFQRFGFGMVSYSNSYSYGHDHSKTKSLEIRTKWQSFCSGIQWFLTKCPPFCSKWPPFCSKQNNIGKLNAFEKQKGGIPLELQMRLVFLPPLAMTNHSKPEPL